MECTKLQAFPGRSIPVHKNDAQNPSTNGLPCSEDERHFRCAGKKFVAPRVY